MAYTRRTLATAFRHLPRRIHPSVPHVLSRDDFRETPSVSASPSPYRSISRFHTSPSPSPPPGGVFYLPLGLHISSLRFFSSFPTSGSNEVDHLKDVANVLTDDSTQEAASAAAAAAIPASFPGEVAAAAAHCSFPVAAFQHFIDQVHTFTGLNWYAFIKTLLHRFFVLLSFFFHFFF
jgi:YidC/Oxa1 family membrane protein insertase